MTSKKAAMELSINAIVILIIAITMLGLGLGFVRGMFGKISTQVEEQVAQEPEPPIPTSDNPITMSRESIVTKAGEDEIIKISIYAPGADIAAASILLDGCGGLSDGTMNKALISANSFKTFTWIVKGEGAVNTYLCSIRAGAVPYSKDYTVKVTQ